jgi:hypothetical protein
MILFLLLRVLFEEIGAFKNIFLEDCCTGLSAFEVLLEERVV